jgi:2-haloacid dehalogenase
LRGPSIPVASAIDHSGVAIQEPIVTPASTRRQLLLAGISAAAAASTGGSLAAGGPIRAVAFDGFPIFDLRPIAARTEALFPGKGAALVSAWRTRQFEYQWLRALAGDYADFVRTTRDGLVFAARALNLELTAAVREQLVGAYAELSVWPDVPSSLSALRRAGLALAVVSNMTQRWLDDGLRRAGLSDAFDHVLSTDRIRTFKPSPQAYQLGVDALRLGRAQILFVPFAGWDVAGAKAFGHPTYWVNRLQAPLEEWGPPPDGVGRGLDDLLSFLDIARG